MHTLRLLILTVWLSAALQAQVTTTGFTNAFRPEAPGTLLSHPTANDSANIGRTTSVNYVNGWVIIGGEAPGSAEGSDLEMRVYDISNPTAPVRRRPSDFGLTYPNNRWHQGNVGWGAHGTAWSGDLLLPSVLRVSSFGGLVELGGTNGIPSLGNLALGYNRSSQAGPWDASMLWYGTPDSTFTIQRVTNPGGIATFQTVASFDHVGPFGGGDWHPQFFGDLLIYMRSGGSARDGVVVYRLQYNNFDNPATRSITPQFVGSLEGGFLGYWPTLFSDGSGLYVIGSGSDSLMGADITQAASPSGSGAVTLSASMTIPGFTNASYPVFQDNMGFIHNRKIDITRFLAGDPNPIVLTLNETATGVNTSQMSLALGNLWLTGGYPIPGTSQGMGVWVHQQAPDTTAPRVSYHIPQANRTNYPRHAPLSFLLHEHPRNGAPRNGIDFMVRPVQAGNTLGSAVSGYLIHDFSGVLTFTPSAGLTADTTYQVDFFSNAGTQTGFRDAAGNYIEAYSYRFSTGGGINATAPPAFTSITASTYQPAPGANVSVSAAATGTGTLEYRFNFAGTWSEWSTTASATSSYATAGRPRVLVQVRDAAGNVTNGSLRLLVITAPTATAPTQSSSMAIGNDPAGRRLWSVNPDGNSVAVLNASTGAKVAEHTVGTNPRNIARDANGRYWVTCHRSDEIRVLNADGTTHTTIGLNYGTQPFGICASPDGQSLFVSLYGTGQVQRYAAGNPSAAPVTSAQTVPTARALAVSGSGTRLFVTRFISADLEGEVYEFNASTMAYTRTIRLESAHTIDGGDRAAGMPNYLSGLAISPDGAQLAVASKHDNIQRGSFFGVGALTHETTVRAVVSFIDLNTNAELRHTRRDFDNSEGPSALTYTPLGDTLLVALQGNNSVVGIDALSLAPVETGSTSGATRTSPAVIALDLGTGLAPQGVLLDNSSQRLFAQNFMGRSVTVRDASPLLTQGLSSLPLIATTSTQTSELLTAQVLLGKQIFYNAADPRMGADSYISCASCHIDGGHDGRVWDSHSRGEGMRRTTDLRGRSGMGHGNLHWSGNFDEIQDFEHDMRSRFGGTGFLSLTPTQFAAQHPSPATGKTGLSADLDALAAYVTSLDPAHTPRSPHRAANGSYTAAASAGQVVFTSQGCATCHSGSALTNSARSPIASTVLSAVGTQSTISGSRLGSALTGIDVPTLHGLHATRSYLHHGIASSLSEVFSYTGGSYRLATSATPVTTVTPSDIQLETDAANEGGGGYYRGAFAGTSMRLNEAAAASAQPFIRFSNVDGGSGGAGRLAIRYVKQYGNGTATLRVNGAAQTLTLLQQQPNNDWMVSGWRWLFADITLAAGSSNTIEIARLAGDPLINAIVVSNANDLATAQPHRLVTNLSTTDRNNLLAFISQQDGRDATGTPLAAPAPPAADAPSIIASPSGQTFAVGNSLSFVVAVSGTGPFTYVWRRGSSIVGSNSPTLAIPSLQLSDTGSYTVTVTNSVGSAVSTPAIVTVNAPLSITTSSLPQASVGFAYSFALQAAGGISARTWSLAAGSLPLGMSLGSNGVLSGTPSTSGSNVITVQVSDSSGSITRQLTLATAPVGGFATDPDLILHYPFDEGSGTVVGDVATAGNNHTTTVSNAHWIATGRFGGAYGPSSTSSYINDFSPANQSDLDFDPRGDAFTISLWVRTSMTTGYNTILSKDLDVSPWEPVQYRLWMINNSSQLQMVNGYAGTTLNLANVPTTGSGLSLNTTGSNNGWHLLTMVSQNESGTWRSRLYIDNHLNNAQVNNGASGKVPSLMRVGDTSRGGNTWAGQLDDLRIYRRALSTTEIASLYTPPQRPLPTIAVAAGQGTTQPYAEFDVTFSEAITGLTVSDFIHSGSAASLSTVTAGLAYRLRIAGYANAEAVSAILPANTVTALDDNALGLASNTAFFSYTAATNGYSAWLAANLSANQLTNAALASGNADHDNNGVPNLLAYGTGSEGTVPISLQVTGPAGDRIATVTTQRNSAATDATYVIECSTNLSQWTALATSVNGAAPTGSATISEGSDVVRQITAQHAVTSAQRTFYRVRVTMP